MPKKQTTKKSSSARYIVYVKDELNKTKIIANVSTKTKASSIAEMYGGFVRSFVPGRKKGKK